MIAVSNAASQRAKPLTQLRDLQCHLAGRRVKLAIVAASPRVLTGFRALVTPGTHKPIRLSLQQGVQRLLHAAAHDVLQGA
jgi:hypothetical protein